MGPWPGGELFQFQCAGKEGLLVIGFALARHHAERLQGAHYLLEYGLALADRLIGVGVLGLGAARAERQNDAQGQQGGQ
jgi:hypothetical protein